MKRKNCCGYPHCSEPPAWFYALMGLLLCAMLTMAFWIGDLIKFVWRG